MVGCRRSSLCSRSGRCVDVACADTMGVKEEDALPGTPGADLPLQEVHLLQQYADTLLQASCHSAFTGWLHSLCMCACRPALALLCRVLVKFQRC